MSKKERSFTFIGDAFSFISNFASILSFLGISTAALMFYLKKYILALGIAVCAFCVWGVFKICFKFRDSIIKRVLRWFAPNSTYSFSKWETEYEYKSLECMSFRTRYSVKAMQAGVNHIRVRFNWSGASESNPIIPKPAMSDGCTTKEIKPAGEEYGYKYFDVFNQTSFNKGDPEVLLGVDIEDMKTDDPQKVSHHLLTSVNVVTDVLTMVIIFPKNIYPENIVAHEYLHATDDNHWREHTTACKLNRNAEGKWVISWSVKNPVFGGKYIIHWKPELINN